ncbi:DnaB family ATPase [Acidovorax sp. Root217]|uniref:replicative DNA helicase n=1 Tax=Acidovorax sp. Root217 TaxID=1736492 RepID=UPI0007093DCD|nr:DnaB family ATPase [Acidovorax sp. Root217]KRC30711.1 helicase DnaB [Acidovorax sp. Root217]
MREQRLAIPVSLEAESAVLGGLLLNADAMAKLPPLEPDAFYDPFHGQVFRAIQRLYAKGHPVEAVSVHLELQAEGADTEIQAVHDLAVYSPGPTSMRMYANAVLDCHRLRKLMEVGNEIARLAMSPGHNSTEQIDKSQMLLGKLATVRGRREPKSMAESLVEYLGVLQELSEGKNPAIRTGIGGLDRMLNGGLRRGEMMVIGARPKHGKTALSLAMARSMAREHGVLFLSQEMNIIQLMHRHTAASGGVDLGRILAAKPEDAGMWSGVSEAARNLGDLRLHQDEQGNLTLMDIRRKVLKVRRESGLDVLFIDFLQLMAGGGEESRNRELDVIVNGIKAMALDLQIAVVLLSQMSRKADEHYGRPQMTHLRDSGAIEAAADQVALLFNDWAHPMSKKLDKFKGFCELEIVAHRNGPQGLVPLHLLGEYQQMGDWMGPIPEHTAISATPPRSRAANF